MTTQLLENKVILITGASSGIGEAAAFACAENGATVVLLARNNKRLENIYDKIVAANLPEPYAISFDLNTANDAEFNALAETIFQQTKRMDGIVHSASYFYALSPLEFQTVDEWVNQYRINTVAPMALTRAFLPLFKRQGGSVVFVGESHSETPKAYWAGFGASRAAVNYLCQSLADEYSRFPNFRANVLIPGCVDSPQRRKTHPGESPSERTPISDIVPQIVWYLSDNSIGKTGEIVYLQGDK